MHEILLSNSCPSLNMFCLMKDNKMVAKMTTACRFALADTLIYLFFPKIDCGYFPNDVQDSIKNGHPCQFACVDTLTWSLFTQCLPNFINELRSSNYCSCLNMGFVRWTIIKIVAKRDILFPLQGIKRGPLLESDCSILYGKACVKGSLKNRQNKDLYDKW